MRYLSMFGLQRPTMLGTTCVLDRGLGVEQMRDWLSAFGTEIKEWKLGWTTWLVSNEDVVRAKLKILADRGVVSIAGGTAGELALHRHRFSEYLDYCRDLGFRRVEVGEGFVGVVDEPAAIVESARTKGLGVQYEVGRKDPDEDAKISVEARLRSIGTWLDAGAHQVVLEAREVGRGYAVLSGSGQLNERLITGIEATYELSQVVFEAPTREFQIGLIRRLGPRVCIANVYPEEFIRVETFRRGLHAETYKTLHEVLPT